MKRHVVVVDDLESVRALVRATLAADERFGVVGEAGDGESAIALVDELGPDLVVLDLSMPNTDGLATLRRITSEHPSVAVVVYSEVLDARDEVLAAGARAFVSKSAPLDELVDALDAATIPHRLVRFGDVGFQRTVLDALDEGVVVQDEAGEIVYANPAAERILDLRAPQLVGLTSRDPRWDAIKEDGTPFEDDEHPVVRTRVTGEPVRGVVMGIRRPSGERRWMQVSARPLFDGGEEPVGAVATFTDVTERRETIEALRASEEQTHRFLEALPVGVAVIERGRMVFINGVGREVLGTGPLDTLVGAEDILEHFLLYQEGTGEPYPFEDLPVVRALWKGEAGSADDVVVRRNGEEVPVESYAAPVEDANGDRQYAIVAFTDISERRAQEARLEAALASLAAANEGLMEFAGVAAHDLAAPLRTVTGFAEMLQERFGADLPEDARTWISYVITETERMREFIDELLAYARAGASTEDVAEVRLEDVAQQALDACAAEIEATGATIDVGKLPVVVGDRVRLVQVLQNLVSNSLKFRAPGHAPTIRIDATRDDGAWVTSVTDDGIGIPEDQRTQIFHPFSRGAAGDSQPGHGLGLTICRRVVERHGGRIWVEPAAGGGTTFRFSLPDRVRSAGSSPRTAS